MQNQTLSTDCTQCAALCCIGLAFDRSTLFAFDKAAGEVCPHLTASHRCGIHADLEQRGFGGCARFDCLGAGQYVTQHLFGGRSWKTEPELAQPMFEAFRDMRKIQELLQLLTTAGCLPLSAEQAHMRRELMHLLAPAEGWSADALAGFKRTAIEARVHAFLKTLRPHIDKNVRSLPVENQPSAS